MVKKYRVSRKRLSYKNKKKKTKINKKYCSPSNQNNKFSCFSKASLIKIINSWNQNNPKNKIKYSNKSSIRILWKKIDNKFNKKCSTEACWLTLSEVKYLDEDVKNTFRPKMPEKWKKNKNEWLTTIDIQNVLKQYQYKYSDFIFIGAVPIDFDKKVGFGQCVVNELCNINIPKLIKKGKTKIAVVFNLDPHDKPGSHWVALYCDFNINKILFFDSYGSDPPNEVKVLMDRLKEQSQKINKDVELIVNKTRHQYKNSECGVYSLNFIIQLLEGKSMDELLNTKILDDIMEKNRKKYFINYIK